ncbi:SDR family NAD(P)-dependent oxidoreductase [Paraburkholderia sp. CNPSo 3281]|uniref:SDR family NAD(P)-dependent oxidoreductase n=1 Tax=Paraburkholderia sp. CNPSo 3281 TaxID=2940933 RepID=UPI0020B82521|nr:SDR family oxidoreductase [Paraburkholderia sp. CNPSo 3281]MCP3721088.1 SDR family oxidoreductase [Paraburkholderia sp. CNPSo 3281]
MSINSGLQGRRILITGATSGLGAHFASVFARQGASVILTGRREALLEEQVRGFASQGLGASYIVADVNDSESRKHIAQTAGEIDVLVNNAGIVIDKPATAQTEADWDSVVDTNLKSMFFLAQEMLEGLKARSGAVINIASILGLRQAGSVMPYAVSKAGVIQLTKTLALEWARYGVRVNALAPGYIETELNAEFWSTPAGLAMIKRIPQRRLGRLQDLDGPILLLGSDSSAYMTGSVIVVDGGHVTSSL